MSEVTLQFHASLDSLALITTEGGVPELPALKLGDLLRCQLRTRALDDGGALTEVWPKVRSVRASIGFPLAPATGGDVMLKKSGGTAFGPISLTTSAADLKALLNATDLGVECIDVQTVVDEKNMQVPGVWLIRFDSIDPVDLITAVNRLHPESFARWRPYQEGNVWWHELRFIQAPLAWNEDGYDRVLPRAPEMRRIRAGGAIDYSDPLNPIALNEIQALTVYPGFSGTFTLRFAARESSIMGIQSDPDEIARALNDMWQDGKTRFKVTNPAPNEAWIEFVGSLGGAEQSLITVSVKAIAPGTLTFTLNLNRAQMHSALRAVAEIKPVLEIELEVVGDEEDPTDPAIAGRVITIAQQEIVVKRELIWDELANIRAIDWLRPPQPRDYIPFTLDQILVGNQATYRAVIGDGEAREFWLQHNLGTSDGPKSLRENAAFGRELRPDEYTLRFPSENDISISFPEELDPPGMNAFVFNFTAAGPASAFQAHHHTIAQIEGLQEALESFQQTISEIEDLLPQTGPPAQITASGRGAREIKLPSVTEVLAGKFAKRFDANKALQDGTGLATRPPAIYPAIHVATTTTLNALPLPDAAANAGKVFVNNTGAIFSLGGAGWPRAIVPVNGFAGSDGRQWYRVNRVGETNSYYPANAERTLFALPINDKMLRAGQTLTLDGKVTFATLKADTAAEYVLVVEVGTTPEQTDPAPTDENLEDVIWNVAEPLLKQRFVFGNIPVDHTFGAQIIRSEVGTFAANYVLYGVAYATTHVPSEPNFALRARLIEFDTQNSATNARGYVYYKFAEGKITLS